MKRVGSGRGPVRAVVGGAAVALAVGASGCGRVPASEKPRGEREPGVEVVTAVVQDDGVRLTPSRVGAGPLRLVVTNQSRAATRPALTRADRTTGAGGGVLEPGAVTTLRADVTTGRWLLRAGTASGTARLTVTRERRSADSDLLQP